jgi:hypothetical protein
MTQTLGNGKICYVEIPASDIEGSAEFYQTFSAGGSGGDVTARSLFTMMWAK